MAIITKTKNKNETNTIYNYLKRNPSIVIALGSFAIALVAAACKMIEYMKLKIYLNKWGFDISYVKTDSISNIYSPISYLIEIVLIFVAFAFIIICLLKNIEDVKYIAFFRYISKGLKTTIKVLKRLVKTNEKDKKASSLLKQAETDLNNCLNKQKEVFKELLNHMSVAINLFVACSFISIFAYIKINIISRKLTFFIVAFWILIVIFYCYIIYKDEYDKAKLLFANVKKADELDEEKIRKYLNEKRIKKDIQIKDVFTDSNIFILFRFFVYFIVLLVIILSFEIKFNKNNKFNIVNIDGENYSIVYKTNDNIYYLDKVYYNSSKSIVVYIDRNKIIKTDNIEIINKEFNNVYLCKYKKD